MRQNIVFPIEKALEYYTEDQSMKQACQKVCEELGIPYEERFRHKLSRAVTSSQKIDQDLENDTDTDTNQYENVSTLSALKPDGTIMNLREYCDFYKIPFEQIRTYKLVTHSSKGAYYNLASNPIVAEHMEKFGEKLLAEIASLSTLPKSIQRAYMDEDCYLLVVDPCDIHVGKLASAFETGEDYNTQIAVKRVHEGVDGILNKVKGFCIDKILFVAGNDILHIDTPKRTTTSGTPQDTDGMWYDNFLLAKQLYIEVLEKLLKVCDVHFVHNPSNHDWTHSWFLADVIKTYFKDCSNITFDCDINHRKYFTYHSNLIGTTHGDGAKMSDLPLLMAHESEDWSNSTHRYIYSHHVHHKSSKDFMGVCVESLRSASGTDGWHSRNGYQHAPKAIEGFLHHKDHGQIARITHIF